MRNLLQQDPLLQRHHQQLPELHDEHLLHLIPGPQLLQVDTFGLGGQPELERVGPLLDDVKHGRKALEEGDEAALSGEAEVPAEAAEVSEVHDAVGLADEDAPDLEDQLQLLVALDDVVEGDLLPTLDDGGGYCRAKGGLGLLGVEELERVLGEES